MREFKFRAWDKELKKMVYEDDEECLIGYDGTELFLARYVYQGEEIQMEIAEDAIFMEWTGIRDSKGQKIYEGDIIEGGYFNPLSKEFYSKLYEVTFKEGNYMAKLIGYSPYGDTFLRFVEGVVVGNIYENKELLKGEELENGN